MQRVSVIVSTYNRSEHLRLCGASLEAQSTGPYEVIGADDGSGQDQVRAIEGIADSSCLEVAHVHQEDNGFRLAAARNIGVRHATGDHLFFTDADMVLCPDCLGLHSAASRGRYWVTGHGLRLNEEETAAVTEDVI